MDDFIFTISDNESIPDYEEEDVDSVAPKAGTKRKREDERAPKDKKKKKKKKNAEENVTENEKAVGEDDGALDPDFEFLGAGQASNIVDGFGDWAQASSGKIVNGDRPAVSVDDIIARRQKAKALSAVEISGAESEDEAEVELDEDEEEVLADDAFGMGADMDENDGSTEQAEDDDEDEEGRTIDADDDDDEEVEDEDVPVGRDDDDSDNDSVAAPVAHPDDEIDPSEDVVDEAEMAKQAAFFAPVDDADIGAAPAASFSTMSLSRPILKGLTAVGFSTPTPIQAKAIPYALQGKDVVGGAVTGSGKTGAFMIPILERLLYRPKKVPTTRVGKSVCSERYRRSFEALATPQSHTDWRIRRSYAHS